MNSSELSAIMERIGLLPSDLEAISGKTSRQVRSWRTGAFPVPKPLALVLLALDDGRIDVRWLLDRLKHLG